MANKIGRNDQCPCGSGKKYKKCCDAAGVVEVISYGDNTTGIFACAKEVHREAETGATYEVRIYSSVMKLIENNDKLKQELCTITHKLLFELHGPDVAFVNGKGSSDDFLIWFNEREQYVMWFTVTQAKSFFGAAYEARFGHVERQPWSRELAVPNV